MHFTLEVVPKIRHFLKNYLENVPLEVLNNIPKGFNNNIIWNIGHVVVVQQLLAYKLSGLPLMISDVLVEKYKKDSKPEGNVTEDEVNELKDLLISTIEKTKQDYSAGIFTTYNEYTVSTTGNTLTNIDEAFQFILLHEGIHLGYIMALYRAIKA